MYASNQKYSFKFFSKWLLPYNKRTVLFSVCLFLVIMSSLIKYQGLVLKVMVVIITELMTFSLLLVERQIFSQTNNCNYDEMYDSVALHLSSSTKTNNVFINVLTLGIFCLSLIFFWQNVFRNQVGYCFLFATTRKLNLFALQLLIIRITNLLSAVVYSV